MAMPLKDTFNMVVAGPHSWPTLGAGIANSTNMYGQSTLLTAAAWRHTGTCWWCSICQARTHSQTWQSNAGT